MNTYRNVAAALAAGAAGLSLAACSAGVTTASTATTAATSSSSPSHRATAASSPAPGGRMLSVSGKVSSFPVPDGAKVAENITMSNTISIMFSKITMTAVQRFYTQALPKAGYTITGNSSASEGGGVILIQFTGHGYKGQVSTLAKDPDPAETIPGLGTKNITTILLQPK